MPLAGSDVIPAKSLSVSQWSAGVTCSSLFRPLKALLSTGMIYIVKFTVHSDRDGQICVFRADTNYY